jgi:hypothetical protein
MFLNDSTWNHSGQLAMRNKASLAVDNAHWTMARTSSGVFQPSVQLDGAVATRPTITVNGSIWNNAGGVRIDTGKMTIGPGSTVTNTYGMLAFDSSDEAEVEVDGGTWNNIFVPGAEDSGRLTVGAGGKAKLTVKNGGIVRSDTGIVADDASSIATAIIDGSNWEVTGTSSPPGNALMVGDTNGAGTQGTLVVRNGGQVSVIAGENVRVLGKGVLAGNGSIIGNISSSATVDPGYVDEITGSNVIGTLAINGNYQQVQGRLKIDMGPAGADKLDVSGNISLVPFFADTVLEVAFTDGFYPSIGLTFDILDWDGTISGTFTGPQLPVLTGGRVWDLSQLYTTGVIKVAGTSTVPGDFNGNGFADAADYIVLRENNAPSTQFTQWRGNFGNNSGAGAGLGKVSEVPEPAGGAFALLAFFIACEAAPRCKRRG